MVFLTSIDILDTGFLTLNKISGTRQSQLSTANRVNSGAALRLKGAAFDLQSTANLDKSKPVAELTTGKHALLSLNPDTFTLTIKLMSKNTDTNNVWGINDMSLLAPLLQLPKTRGIKALFYAVDNAATGDTRGLTSQMIYQIGTPDTIQTQGDINLTLWAGSTSVSGKNLTNVNYIGVRFDSVKQTQKPNNVIEITCTGVITE
jgi:hypothetical protein